MQSSSCRIWTRVADSISCDDNRYAKRTFECMCACVYGVSVFNYLLKLADLRTRFDVWANQWKSNSLTRFCKPSSVIIALLGPGLLGGVLPLHHLQRVFRCVELCPQALNRQDLHFEGAGNGPVVISWIGREQWVVLRCISDLARWTLCHFQTW